jgi:CMP-N-acetylneuraminic acid synthetase
MEINYLAIIPARSGSKGLPDKNIKKICGKTLIEIAVLNAKKVEKIDGIFFTSDSEEYIKIYKNLNIKKDVTYDYIRPTKISEDTSPSSDYIVDCLEFLEKKNIKVKNIVLLQVTSPLRQYTHIISAIDEYECGNKTSLVSVNESVNHPCNTLILKDEIYIPITKFSFTRRQDFKNSVTLNGAIYIITSDEYKKTNVFMNNNTNLFFMDKILSIDIDDEQDFYLAELVYSDLLNQKIIEKI